MKYLKSLLTFSLLAMASAQAGTPLDSNQLYFSTENFYKLFEKNIEHCFVEEADRLDFYLSRCEQTAGRKPQQSFALSARPQTRLSADIAKLKEEILASGAATDTQITELETLAKKDTLGRIILMDVAGKQIPVGWLSHELALDGTESHARVQGLCGAVWGYVCSFDSTDNLFKIGYRTRIQTPENGIKDGPRAKILRVLYSGIYTRGNDDFVAYHYLNIKGLGEHANDTYPISSEWKEAIAPYIDASRVDPQIHQVKTPRGEPNYLTALHPVYLLEVLNENGKKQTELVFGGVITYLKMAAAEESCEDDTATYELVDFDLFKNKLSKPYSGRDIEKLNLSKIAPEEYGNHNLHGEYQVDFDADFEIGSLPKAFVSQHYDLSDIATGFKIDATKAEQTFIIMKVDRSYNESEEVPSSYLENMRSNAVREYVEIKKTSDDNWNVNISAFNPNDYRNSNKLRQDGKFYITAETVNELGNKTKGLVGFSQPFQRALSAQLKNYEKAAKKDLEDRSWFTGIADQHNKNLYDNYQPYTIHRKYGITGNYIRAFEDYIQNGKESMAKNPMRSIVPRVTISSLWVSDDDFADAKFELTNPMVVEIYTGDRAKQYDQTIKAALQRIGKAANPAEQIKVEAAQALQVNENTSFVRSFFSTFSEIQSDASNLNESLVRAHSFPVEKRPKGFYDDVYDDNGEKTGEKFTPFSPNLLALIMGKDTLNVKPFFADIEKDLLALKDLEKKSDKAALLARGKEMYRKIIAMKTLASMSYRLNIELNKIKD